MIISASSTHKPIPQLRKIIIYLVIVWIKIFIIIERMRSKYICFKTFCWKIVSCFAYSFIIICRSNKIVQIYKINYICATAARHWYTRGVITHPSLIFIRGNILCKCTAKRMSYYPYGRVVATSICCFL